MAKKEYETPCAVCGEYVETHMEPSRSTLVFGMMNGRVKMEARCNKCERELIKDIKGMLKR